MALTLNKRVWVLAERLYITAHKAEHFLKLLQDSDIDYPGEPYKKFGETKALYTFMSEESYEFANFMQPVQIPCKYKGIKV